MANGILAGTGTELDPYLIEDIADFNEIRGNPQYFTQPYFVKQVNDLDINGANFDDPTRYFCCTYDGNNKKISNFALTTSLLEPHASFNDYTVKNLTLENIVVNTTDRFNGVLQGYGTDNINPKYINVNIYNITINSAGGAAFYGGYENYENCNVTGSAIYTGADAYVGNGFCNALFGNNIVENCNVDFNIVWQNITHGINCGVFTDQVYYGCQIKNCTAKGKITIDILNGNGIVGIGGFTESAYGSGGAVLFENCISDVEIAYTSNTNITGNSGGFVGEAHLGVTFKNCRSLKSVSGAQYVGGFVGQSYDAIFEECYTLGDAIGSTTIGGFVGFTSNRDTEADTFKNCYAGGNVSGVESIGGFVGETYCVEFNNCYSIGSVIGSGDASTIGGFTGFTSLDDIDNISIFTSCYYDSEISGQSDTGKGEPKTTVEMQMKNTFLNWDFDTIWNINSLVNNGCPYYKKLIDSKIFIWVKQINNLIDLQFEKIV